MTKTMVIMLLAWAGAAWAADDFPKPYSPPCTERENVFAFAEKPAVRSLGNDKYEITFAVNGNCDVTVGIVDQEGKVVRHLGSGVLGANAPAPFQPTTGGSASGGKISLKQTIYWNGKDDLDVYHKEPGKLKVRVMLGLKPEFDKRLGGTSPYNLPARILGLGADPGGIYVLTKGARAKFYMRKYDLNGNYVGSLVPPPANMPEEKLQGMGYIEYEKGKRALQGRDIYHTTGDHMCWPGFGLGKYLSELQPAVVNGRIYILTAGGGGTGGDPIFYLNTDGSTDLAGLSGRRFLPDAQHLSPRMTASPDGKWIYMTGIGGGSDNAQPAVMRLELESKEPAKLWLGDLRNPGSDEKHFNNPHGVACDAQGRLYVCDNYNGRVQVFVADGKFVKTIPVERPWYVCVHQKTGAIYVQHDFRQQGTTNRRVTKLASLERPDAVAFIDGVLGTMALDSWSAKPRLWIANTLAAQVSSGVSVTGKGTLEVWEDEGNSFKKVLDFDERMKAEEGEAHVGRWEGSALGGRVVCNAVREQVYCPLGIFDLSTGKRLGKAVLRGHIDDVTFDKKGYMHCHFNPGFYQQGVGRLNPVQASLYAPYGKVEPGCFVYKEVPYDYGEEAKDGWQGVLPVKDQPGAKFFQDGIGVNMRGDVAVQSNIYYVPKQEEFAAQFFEAGRGGDLDAGGGKNVSYAGMVREFQEKMKLGEQVYSIRRRPGIPLTGGTVWTFDWNGELRQECAVLAGDLINGVQMDEDRHLYYVAGKLGNTRMLDGRPFLQKQHGIYGMEKKPEFGWTGDYVFTGTLIKTAGERATLLMAKWAAVPLDEPPKRPQEVTAGWVEGAEWLYAGASPIVSTGCSCPTQRSHLDWYKRSYVPEQYRHSIGILDTNGNLIMHLGRYGNFDSGDGAKSRIPVGGDNIAMCAVRFVSGTDNYLVFEDNGERLVVLKLNYHAEESVGISNQ